MAVRLARVRRRPVLTNRIHHGAPGRDRWRRPDPVHAGKGAAGIPGRARRAVPLRWIERTACLPVPSRPSSRVRGEDGRAPRRPPVLGPSLRLPVPPPCS